jgi:hypothetical protein
VAAQLLQHADGEMEMRSFEFIRPNACTHTVTQVNRAAPMAFLAGFQRTLHAVSGYLSICLARKTTKTFNNKNTNKLIFALCNHVHIDKNQSWNIF